MRRLCTPLTRAAAAQGALVYRLMGDAAEGSFTRGWGVALAISQATQFQSLLLVALESALLLTVLETLWLVSNRPWFEAHIDYASVHALLLTGRPTPWWTRVRTHVAFFSAVS